MVNVMRLPSRTGLTLMAEQQISYFDDLCYSAGLRTLRSFRETRVDYFSERCLLRIIDWMMKRWPVDRRFVRGGPLHFGIRHPEVFGLLSFGRYTASYDFKWAPQVGALGRNLGPPEVALTVDGHRAWEVYDIGWYLRRHPGRDIPFMMCISGTGKDVGHTSEFGWQDDPRGWAALRDARQPFLAAWTTEPPREVRTLLENLPADRSIPAFSRCSLDNNPGNGDPADGDPAGYVNGWLLWRPEEQVDEPDRWEATVLLARSSPEETCTVDVTPRRCRRFKPRPGDTFRWSNTRKADGKVVQGGTVTADRWGLLTLPGVVVGKGDNRLSVRRAE